MLLTMLADGRLHLTGIALLAPHLTRENRDRAPGASHPPVQASDRGADRRDRAAAGRSGGGAEAPGEKDASGTSELPRVTSRRGSSEWNSVRTELPHRSSPAPVAPVSPAVVQPLSPGRYKVQFTASAELHDKLERLRALMGGKYPKAIWPRSSSRRSPRSSNGSRPVASRGRMPPARASRRRTRRPPRATYPRPSGGRCVSATETRCRYVDEQGRRCPERDRLEFHHRHPFGLGGDHSVENIRLMCQRPQRVPGRARLRQGDHGPAPPSAKRRLTGVGQLANGRALRRPWARPFSRGAGGTGRGQCEGQNFHPGPATRTEPAVMPASNASAGYVSSGVAPAASSSSSRRASALASSTLATAPSSCRS